MLLHEHFAQSGQRLFRWRGQLPLLFLPFLIYAGIQGEAIEARFGEVLGDAYETMALGLIVLGQTIRILTVGFVPGQTSGRNTKGQVAQRLNTTGAYSVVRNPLYVGNCLIYVGLALFSQNLYLASAVSLILLPFYERIIAAEESYLTQRFGEAYTSWAARTPAFVPSFDRFTAPALPFSWRAAIRREQTSVYLAFVAVQLIEMSFDLFGPEPEPLDIEDYVIIGGVTLVYLAAKLVKHHTSVLNVDGR